MQAASLSARRPNRRGRVEGAIDVVHEMRSGRHPRVERVERLSVDRDREPRRRSGVEKRDPPGRPPVDSRGAEDMRVGHANPCRHRLRQAALRRRNPVLAGGRAVPATSADDDPGPASLDLIGHPVRRFDPPRARGRMDGVGRTPAPGALDAPERNANEAATRPPATTTLPAMATSFTGTGPKTPPMIGTDVGLTRVSNNR